MQPQEFLNKICIELLISKNTPSTIQAYTNATQALITFTNKQPEEEFGNSVNQITRDIDNSQILFMYCMTEGKGDVHQLDRDEDLSACETLP